MGEERGKEYVAVHTVRKSNDSKYRTVFGRGGGERKTELLLQEEYGHLYNVTTTFFLSPLFSQYFNRMKKLLRKLVWSVCQSVLLLPLLYLSCGKLGCCGDLSVPVDAAVAVRSFLNLYITSCRCSSSIWGVAKTNQCLSPVKEKVLVVLDCQDQQRKEKRRPQS